MNKSQLLNYLAVDVLEKAGISCPTQDEINIIEYLLRRLCKRRKI